MLRTELKLAGVDLRIVFPNWAKAKSVREGILRELLIALEAPVHEGLIPPYGSILVQNSADLDSFIALKEEDLDLARRAADGSSALVAFQGDTFVGLKLLDPTEAPELALTRISRSAGGVAFRRDRNGVVRVFSSRGSVRHAGREWTQSPSIGDAVDRVRRVAPMAPYRELHELLEFAYHVLSPWHIGCTLVWILSDRDVSGGIDLRSLQLTVIPQSGMPSLSFTAHLLAQFDGATVVSSDGRITASGIHLIPTPRAEQVVSQLRGTRHTSARRASYDQSDALIVTVSSDGPVTIFSDGMSVFELNWFSADEQAVRMHRALGDMVEDSIYTSAYEAICPNCGKTSLIEKLTLAGWRDHEEADCPVCGHVVAEGHCWQIHANLKKVF